MFWQGKWREGRGRKERDLWYSGTISINAPTQLLHNRGLWQWAPLEEGKKVLERRGERRRGEERGRERRRGGERG